MEYMIPPITLCRNGHNICNSCKPNLETCPNCRDPILHTRNYALEDLCHKLKYPCKFHDEGCEDIFSVKHIKEHQAVCHHGIHNCPLDRVPEIDCEWNGEYKKLITHLESQHGNLILSGNKFLSPETDGSAFILLVHNEIFLFYKCYRDGKCYCVVQLFGTSAEASDFKYKVKLNAENKVEKLSQVNLVRSITEEFDTTFRAGNCVRLDEEVVCRFVVDGVMQLQVEVGYAKPEELQGAVQSKVRKSGFQPTFSGRSYWQWCKEAIGADQSRTKTGGS
jgi:E3 ubiquitin-protein ligase SIAH1